jgi:membrane protein
MLPWFNRFIKRWAERVERVRVYFFRKTFVRFAYNVAQTMGKDYVGIMAAGISYYAFLSLFPLAVGLIAILGFLLPSETIYQTIFNILRESIPASTEVLESNIRSVVELRGTLGVIGIVGLLFGDSAVLSAISLAINRAWDLWPRPIYIRKPQELLMILALGLIIILVLGLSTFLSFLGSLNIPGIDTLQFILVRLVIFLLIAAVFLLLYKFIPNTTVRWGDIWRGAILGSIMFQIALWGFTFFLQNFAAYNLIYGSLASLVVILIWIYISSFILILCAEINTVYNRMFRWPSG